jgi:hypothetical protein
MSKDTGIFQINDIILNIPPQSISVDRQSAVQEWQSSCTIYGDSILLCRKSIIT